MYERSKKGAEEKRKRKEGRRRKIRRVSTGGKEVPVFEDGRSSRGRRRKAGRERGKDVGGESSEGGRPWV